jgi:anti-sigma-K factor RskA
LEDIKAYIESGILELYVLGDISADEKLQVEDMASKFADIKAELTEIENALEIYAEKQAVEPSEQLRNKVLNSLLTNLGDDRTFTKPRKHQEEEYEDEREKVTLPVKRINFYKYAFAACLTLLLISIYALVNLYSKLQDSNTQLASLLSDKQHIANQVNLLDNQLDMYRDPTYKVLKLQGTPKTPKSALTVAWNSESKKVMVDMESIKLPQTDKKHQYQLWALVSGKPVSIGLIDTPAADTSGLKEMKSIASAEAFAVTLEPTGGSVNPTMDQMVVIGKF